MQLCSPSEFTVNNLSRIEVVTSFKYVVNMRASLAKAASPHCPCRLALGSEFFKCA